MKKPYVDLLRTTAVGRVFLLFWSVCIFLIVGRCLFDFQTRLCGSSLIVHGRHHDYWLHLPKGFKDDGVPRPLLIYLHGAGELKKNVRSLRRVDPVAYAGGRIPAEDFPFLVVCPKSDTPPWKPDKVIAFLDELLADERTRWKIDPERIYLTGFSMGGFGTWETAIRYPDRFAAIAPVAGGCRETGPERFGDLPVWAFHGELDEVVPPDDSIGLTDALKRIRGESDATRLTLYSEKEHGIAEETYGNVELYRWLLRYRIKERVGAESGMISSP